jgi:hypothetical protein
VRRVLAYCGFLQGPDITTPETGVDNAPVSLLAHDGLRLMWSEVEWPFAQGKLQQSAVDFHGVIEHVFRQVAVVPFRLLSVFDDPPSLEKFAAEHVAGFVADLERLRDMVQMEAIVYVIAPRVTANSDSGRAYLEQKAGMLRFAESHAAMVREAIQQVSQEVRIRQVKSGMRIFALVQRGNETQFRDMVASVPLRDGVSRRVSGPWPTAEFLSSAVKMPEIAGQR